MDGQRTDDDDDCDGADDGTDGTDGTDGQRTDDDGMDDGTNGERMDDDGTDGRTAVFRMYLVITTVIGLQLFKMMLRYSNLFLPSISRASAVRINLSIPARGRYATFLNAKSRRRVSRQGIIKLSYT